ncbi:MAG: succinyl-CoA synthetase subunit beta [Hyphomicrobiaceae bacterium]|nr:succinyl-CoA synthetase subunit beta [Hyphomicrobiaceae bacterium]
MDLHEFQAKELLERFGIDIPGGRVVESAADAQRAAEGLGGRRFVVKAQIRTADRAKHGGVRFADSPRAAGVEAGALIGRSIATPFSPDGGARVKWVYVEEAVAAAQSLYAAVVLERTSGHPVMLASARGGEDLEERAERDAAAIQRAPLNLRAGGADGDFGGLTGRIGLAGATAASAEGLFRQLARAFVALDATLIEVNPIALTADGRLIALDAKLSIDDNALFRHADLRALRDFMVRDESDPVELEAQQHQINYIRMAGNIGVLVNGAGLALATLDMVCDAGGRPANFMDIRTTATSLDIARGFGLILDNPAVRSILVNVHGGGMQACDTIAEGIGIAVRRRAARCVPIVICLAGNHAEFARTVLYNTGVPHMACSTPWAAVQQAVASAKRETPSWLSSLVAKRA